MTSAGLTGTGVVPGGSIHLVSHAELVLCESSWKLPGNCLCFPLLSWLFYLQVSTKHLIKYNQDCSLTVNNVILSVMTHFFIYWWIICCLFHSFCIFYRILTYTVRNKHRMSHACGSLVNWSRFLLLLGYNLSFLKTVLEYFHIILSFCLVVFFKSRLWFRYCVSSSWGSRDCHLIWFVYIFYSKYLFVFTFETLDVFKFLLKTISTMTNVFDIVYAFRQNFCFAEINILINI